MQSLLEKQKQRLWYWYPAILAGLTIWLATVFIGSTPIIRATALSVVIVGISLSLRRLSASFSYMGGVALGFTPAYWSQTGGPPSANGWLILAFIVSAGIVAFVALNLSTRVFLSFAIGVSLFVGLYLIFGITVRSLRITTILSAWLLYMLIVAIRQTNPRPEEPAAVPLSKPHSYGVLLMMMLGILNDPLFTLFAPAVFLGLWLARAQLPRWYWGILLAISVVGAYGIVQLYVSLDWLSRSAYDLHVTERFVPFIVLDGWREPVRWMYITRLMTQQFTWVGLILSIVGIARMARWYPTLGVTMMVAYASYGLFGLVYFGKDIQILLLPMIMIQVISLTYAIYAVLQWSLNLSKRDYVAQTAQLGINFGFAILNLALLLRIVGAN